MKYRVFKLSSFLNHIGKPKVEKGIVIDAPNDEDAIKTAHDLDECPVCEVWDGTRKVGVVK